MGKDSFHSFRKECTYSVISDNSGEKSNEGYFVRTTEYALYPNREQERKLLLFLEVCREVYDRLWKVCKFLLERNLGLPNDIYLMKIARGIWNHNEWMKPIYQNCLNDVAKRVHKAFKSFLKGRKEGRKVGYPRYKSRNRYDSFTYPHSQGYYFVSKDGKKGGFDRIRLGKIGNIRFGNRFRIPGIMKTATISRTRVGKEYRWKICIVWMVNKFTEHQTSLDFEDTYSKPIGMDLGLRSLAAFSDGTVIPNDNTYRRKESELVKVQRKLSKAIENNPDYRKSDDYYRMRARLTHKFRKLKNHRKDIYHKTTRDITYNHGDIYAESLNVKELSEETESKTMKKQFRDAAWTTFMNMLSYKAEEAGTVIHKVDPAYTSQVCSRCGNLVEKDLSVRIHECPYCNLRMDRDINAARNILKRGLGAARQVRGQRQISEPLPVSTYGI